MKLRIVSGWSSKPAGSLVHPAGFVFAIVAAAMASASPLSAAPYSMAAAERGQLAVEGQLNWFAADRSADKLIELLASANLDGLDPSRFDVDALRDAVRQAGSGDPDDLRRADKRLTEAFVRYVTALRTNAGRGWVLVDKGMSPAGETPNEILAQAAKTPSLANYIGDMAFMHPAYGQLRHSLTSSQLTDSGQRALVILNMERLRMLPAAGRYILVNAASQRLQMYDDGRVVDEMKVVVGKTKNPTPVMAAYIRYAALNPYWEVPPDLAAERVAPGVVSEGLGYLKKHGYVVLSDWGATAQEVDPSTIDWQAVADGRVQVRLRQNPGSGNAMGRMKFMFPNSEGVYLHDTPQKELLNEAARLFSGGCVRLEDAPRLARWMFGTTLDPTGAQPDQRVDLPKPVPVYIAYLTAMPNDGELSFYDDIYGRDLAAIELQQHQLSARRSIIF